MKQLTPDEEKAVANLIVLGNRNCTRHLQRTTRLRVYVHLFLPPPAPRDGNPRSHPRRGDNNLASSGAGSALFLPAGFSHQFFGLLEGGRAALTTMYTSTSSLSPSPLPQTLPFSTFLPHAKSSRLPPACPPPWKGLHFHQTVTTKATFTPLLFPSTAAALLPSPNPLQRAYKNLSYPPPYNAVLFQESRAQRGANVNALVPLNKKDQVLERKCQV